MMHLYASKVAETRIFTINITNKSLGEGKFLQSEQIVSFKGKKLLKNSLKFYKHKSLLFEVFFTL